MWYVGVSAINRIINCMGCDRLGQVSINAFCATMSEHGYVGDTDCTRQTISAVVAIVRVSGVEYRAPVDGHRTLDRLIEYRKQVIESNQRFSHQTGRSPGQHMQQQHLLGRLWANCAT